MRILVTGGTGALGRPTVQALQTAGATVRVLSRGEAPSQHTALEWAKADLATGTGLREALEGVDTVVHAAHDGPKYMQGDQSGLEHLLTAAKAAGVKHLVYVSIVGARWVPGLGYYAAKARAEQKVRSSGFSSSIFRASQFYGFLEGLLSGLNRLPWLMVPRGLRFQPVDVNEAGAALARHTLNPRAAEYEFVGPEVRDLRDLAAAYLSARGQKKRILELPLPLPLVRAIAAGKLTSSTAERGSVTWEAWLSARFQVSSSAGGPGPRWPDKDPV